MSRRVDLLIFQRLMVKTGRGTVMEYVAVVK